MLAGRFYLTKCRSLRNAQAQVRLTLTPVASLHVRCSYLHKPAREYSEAVTQNQGIQSATAVAVSQHGCHPTFYSRTFSTTSALTLLPGKRERDYLQPRNKPRFRKRGKEEKVIFVSALEAAQNEHDVLSLQSKQHKSNSHDTGVELNSGRNATTPFSSPFFDTSHPYEFFSGPNFRAQHSSRKITRPPKGFPQLSSHARHRVSTTDLEQELYYISHNNPYPTAIWNILKILVYDRKIKPAPQHYEALILANCWPEYGSVQNVEKILMEMEAENIEIGAGIIVAVLRVLSVHPSPGLSHEMLAIAERRWLQLGSQSYHHLILAMIRTGQIELAAWTLDVLRTRFKTIRIADREVIPDYLHVLLMAEMVRVEDWEGLLRYMYKLRDRKASDREIPEEFWGWVLERAAKAARTAVEQSQPHTRSHNQHYSPRQIGSATQHHRSPQETSDPLDTTMPPLQSDTAEAPRSTRTLKNPPFQSSASDSNHDPHRQLSLSNPAKYLTEYIWILYVEPMSIRPSWTTCLHTLHIAALTGTAWLADSTLAVMTYMDGLTPDGNTKTDVGNEVRDLVRVARDRHAAMKDSEAEAALRAKEREAQRKKDEYQVWWADLMEKLDGRKGQTPGGDGRQGSDRGKDNGEGKGVAQSEQKLPAQDTEGTAISTTDGKVDRHVAGLRLKEYAMDERNSPLLANLWPAFPHFDGLGSARVDAWTALGPRSSARGKWTEAQKFYKQQEKAGRKK